MTHSGDREPLLRQDSGEFEGGKEEILEMFEACYMNCLKFYYGKKERFIPKAVFVVISIFSIIFAMDQYKLSMREIESKECNDPLSECENIPFKETLVSPFYNYLQDFTVSYLNEQDTVKTNWIFFRLALDMISLCLLPKVISTVGTATVCYIDDPVKFKADNRSITTETYNDRFCEKNEMKSFEMVKYYLNENFENLIVTRNPYDRFISGFTEKCVNSLDENYCHGCGTDMRCFLQKEYRRLMRMTMLFPVYTVADTHFAPQTWYCDMKNTLKNSTVVRFSLHGVEKIKMIDDMLKFFRKRGVPERQLDEIRKELTLGKNHSSTTGTALREKYEKLIREDESIRRALHRIYYYDFLYLGYEM
ncbi:hypothetical protein GCK72_014723 [Caenorhabditis remanei]|uniref:Sulfotransferase domain-containing protein n=1 Tax=Caenorhabditis remanei TaxID=31234 RepID=A0A6A5GUV4_CAERE|nr:hypothetical protein GCK72_014723 [Caenorhabditis remanei]KAF1758265.1 hypothetical protein GCK72_014723 [Caenorhabditis remanei]